MIDPMKVIQVISPDDMVVCSHCGRRAEVDDTVFDTDEDGPVFRATCPEHGSFLWQVEEDDD